MGRQTYHIITGREKKWWWIEIEDVPGGFSQARQFRNVEPMAREVISLLLEVPEDSFDVEITVKGTEADVLRAVTESEAALNDALAALRTRKKEAVHKLREMDIPVRDVAELLRISTGQVNELSKAS